MWVKAHNGIVGNEIADQYAKQAAMDQEIYPTYEKYPISVAKRIYQRRMLDKWNIRYINGKYGNVTKRYIPSIHHAIRLWNLTKPNFFTSQALTGHGALRKYLHVRKLTSDSKCNFCNTNEEQDSFHVLERCAYFSPVRDICNININYNLFVQNKDEAMLTLIHFFEGVMKRTFKRNSTLSTRNNLTT